MLWHTLGRLGLPFVIAASLGVATPAWAQHRGVSHGSVSHGHVSGGISSHVHAAPARAFHAPAVRANAFSGHAFSKHAFSGHALPARSFAGRSWVAHGGYPYRFGHYGNYGRFGHGNYYPWWGGLGYSGYGYSYPSYYSYSYPSYYGNAYPTYDYDDSYYDPNAYNDYASYGTYVPPVADTTVLPAPPTNANTALVTVSVPTADAELWFNGVQMTQTGSVRQFATPTLTQGVNYTYEVRARWMENGAVVERTRQVGVHTGDRITVDFREPI
jgi:uncharacterized protein (TIGR03000 family)